MATIHDPLVVSRYIAAILERVEGDGLTIDVDTDFHALQRLCASVRGKAPLSEQFSPDFFDIGPADGLWICGSDAAGRVTHIQAMRRDVLEGIDLASHWRQQLRRTLVDRDDTAEIGAEFCPAASAIQGVVIEHGEMWIAPRLRRRRLAGLLSRLALGLAVAKWAPDFVYGFVAEALVMKGFPAREGYMHMQPMAVGWVRPPDHINSDDWLVWMAAQDLDYLVRQPIE